MPTNNSHIFNACTDAYSWERARASIFLNEAEKRIKSFNAFSELFQPMKFSTLEIKFIVYFFFFFKVRSETFVFVGMTEIHRYTQRNVI